MSLARIEQRDHSLVVGIGDQIIRKAVESIGVFRIDFQHGAPFRFRIGGSVCAVQRLGQEQVQLDVAVTELLRFPQRGNRFLGIAREIEAPAKHEGDVGHIFLLWIHLQRGCESVGGAAVVLLLAKPDAQVIQCVRIRRTCESCLHRLRRRAGRLRGHAKPDTARDIANTRPNLIWSEVGISSLIAAFRSALPVL